MENKLVSIIMPAHNASTTIERAIFSVLKQTHKLFELIVMDDCSTDNTVEIVKSISDERITIYQNKTNLRAGLTRNVGIEKAKGEYIAFLDSDDAWTIDKLEKDLAFFKEHPNFDLVGNQYLSIALILDKAKEEPLTFNEITIKSLLTKNPVFTSTVMFKKHILTRFPENFHVSEDLYFWARILIDGYRIAVTNQITSFYNNALTNRLSLNFKGQYVHEKKVCDMVKASNKISGFECFYFKVLYFLKFIRRPIKFKILAIKEKKLAKSNKGA